MKPGDVVYARIDKDGDIVKTLVALCEHDCINFIPDKFKNEFIKIKLTPVKDKND